MRKQLKKENQHVLLLTGAKYTKYGMSNTNLIQLTTDNINKIK